MALKSGLAVLLVARVCLRGTCQSNDCADVSSSHSLRHQQPGAFYRLYWWFFGAEVNDEEHRTTEIKRWEREPDDDYDDPMQILGLDTDLQEEGFGHEQRQWGWLRQAAESEKEEEDKINPERQAYMDAKFNIDLRVVRSFSVPSTLPPLPGSSPMVAFMFLTMEEVLFEKVWIRFFEEAPAAQFSIYVHRAARNRTTSESITWPLLPLSEFGAVEVGPVKTDWCALMGVEVAMLAAALKDRRNQQFVFLSQDSVPLKGFDYVYRQLVVNSHLTSKICLAQPALAKTATAETIRNELARTCVFRDFYRVYNPRTLKHHQWVVLARAHAETVVEKAEQGLDIWRKSWERAAHDLSFAGEGCSDESVPITALLHDIKESGRSTGNTWTDLTRMGVEQQCLTYVAWRHCFAGTRLNHSDSMLQELNHVRRHGHIRMITDQDFDFFRSPLKEALNGYPTVFKSLPKEYLEKLAKEGFMFARKFAADFEVEGDSNLDDVLAYIWGSIDEEEASQRVWRRNSKVGVPRPI